MRERKNRMVPAGFVLAVSLLAASVTAFLSAGYYNRVQIRVLGEICGDVIEREPQAKGGDSVRIEGVPLWGGAFGGGKYHMRLGL